MAYSTKYNDIIELPHYVSSTRARMSNYQRAAQFAPFWALNGHETMVRETERYVDDFSELAGDQQTIIDLALREIADNVDSHPFVRLTYFEPDKRKTGGQYVDYAGEVSAIAPGKQTLTLSDGTSVDFWQIRTIQLSNERII